MMKTTVGIQLTLFYLLITFSPAPATATVAWTGEIRGRVVCDVCGDSSIVLEGAEVAVLCITKTGEELNYQAFTNSKGVYTVVETMPESEQWDACLAKPISSFHEQCSHAGCRNQTANFSYNRPSGQSYTVRPFIYRHFDAPMCCMWNVMSPNWPVQDAKLNKIKCV